MITKKRERSSTRLFHYEERKKKKEKLERKQMHVQRDKAGMGDLLVGAGRARAFCSSSSGLALASSIEHSRAPTSHDGQNADIVAIAKAPKA